MIFIYLFAGFPLNWGQNAGFGGMSQGLGGSGGRGGFDNI